MGAASPPAALVSDEYPRLIPDTQPVPPTVHFRRQVFCSAGLIPTDNCLTDLAGMVIQVLAVGRGDVEGPMVEAYCGRRNAGEFHDQAHIAAQIRQRFPTNELLGRGFLCYLGHTSDNPGSLLENNPLYLALGQFRRSHDVHIAAFQRNLDSLLAADASPDFVVDDRVAKADSIAAGHSYNLLPTHFIRITPHFHVGSFGLSPANNVPRL